MIDHVQRWRQISGVVAGILVVLLSYVGVRRLLNPVFVPNPQPVESARAAELEDRFDPNVADWQTIAALPGIGEKKAKTIIAYRDDFLVHNPGHRAFEKPADLLRVRGIGTGLLSQMQPYLRVPAIAPTSSPATMP